MCKVKLQIGYGHLLEANFDIETTTLSKKKENAFVMLPSSSRCFPHLRDVDVDVLLARGADVDALSDDNYDNHTALHLAASQKNVEVVKVLLNKGADVNAVNKVDNTHV